jgi:hypothetical protein
MSKPHFFIETILSLKLQRLKKVDAYRNIRSSFRKKANKGISVETIRYRLWSAANI